MEDNGIDARLTKLENQVAQIFAILSKLSTEDKALAPLLATKSPTVTPTEPLVVDTKEDEVAEEILLVPRSILMKESSYLMEGRNHENLTRAEIHLDVPQEDDTLLSRLIAPDIFQRPEFTKKYDGIGCPKTHINYFLGEMTEYVDNDSLLIQNFQYTLIGPALSWFMALDIRGIEEWDDLADQFLQQYRYNEKTVPTRMDLKHVEMRRNEYFRSFAQRWRAKAAQVQPPLDEDELVGYFLIALPYKFFDRLHTSGCQSFSHLVDVGERVEWAMRNDKSRNKKNRGEYSQVKGLSNEVKPACQSRPTMDQTLKNESGYQLHVSTPYQGQYGSKLEKSRKSNQVKKSPPKQFTPLPYPYSKLLPMLLENGLVAKEPPRRNPPKNFSGHDEAKTCVYHMGEKGHDVDNCLVLKYKVQALIDGGLLEFDKTEPNVQQNPLPDHGRVNAIWDQDDISDPKMLANETV